MGEDRRGRIFDKFGYTAIEILIVASIVGLIPVSVYRDAYKRAQGMSCLSNLRNIYMAVEMYEMDNGTIPNIKFYPEDAENDPGSILNVLRHYIDDPGVYVCSAMPDELKKSKLTYIWNDSYNNKRLYLAKGKDSMWLVTEMTAVKPEIPPPHKGAYNVLFLDGHIESVKRAVYLMPTPAYLKDSREDAYAAKHD